MFGGQFVIQYVEVDINIATIQNQVYVYKKQKCRDNVGEVMNVYHNYIVSCIEKVVISNFDDDLVIAATHSFNVSIKSDCSCQTIEFLDDAQMVLISQHLKH